MISVNFDQLGRSGLLTWFLPSIYLDGEEAAGHLDDGRAALEVILEQLDVDGGRHEDQLQVWPRAHQAVHHAQQKIA